MLDPTRKHMLLWLSVLPLLVGAPRCPRQGPTLAFLSPTSGELIEACSLTVELEVGGTADANTVVARLNGEPIELEGTVVQSSPARWLFTATLGEGAPQPGANTLEAEVQGITSAHGSASTSLNFSYDSPELAGREITDAADLIGGPMGDSRLGDFLLQNCEARFVVQKASQRDLTAIAQYGGNLIDAELRDRPGSDSFRELQPMLNLETVVNADSVVVVNDGADGNPVIVRSCGPDDLLDYINPDTLVEDLVGFPAFPPSANDKDQDVVACTEYTLMPGRTYLEITTEVENIGTQNVGMFVGDFVTGAGELEQWTSEGLVGNPPGVVSAVGEQLATISLGVFSLFGFGEARGSDYAYVPITLPAAGQTSSFTLSGFSVLLHSHSVIAVLFVGQPPFFVVPKPDPMDPTANRKSFTRFFGVGDGSGGSAVDLEIELTGTDYVDLSGCVTVGGVPAPGARVVAGFLQAGTIERPVSMWVTGEDGCYAGRLPADPDPFSGTLYGLAAARKGTPYIGGGPTPFIQTHTFVGGTKRTTDFALPATGRVVVHVTDESGDPLPARVGVVGTDPSPEVLFPGNLFGLDLTTSLFHDATDDPIPQGLTWIAYSGADGTAAFDLEPGTYDVWVSRGSEYSAVSQNVTVSAAPAPPTTLNAQLARVIDTAGFVSSDFHVHMLPSFDSRINLKDRVTQFAGEGVENIVATDHDRHTDLDPTIAALGLAPFVAATVGEEITTFDYGHFNAYPLGIDPDRLTGGSTDWAVPAPIGMDFPSAGAFTGTPESLLDLVFTTQRLAGGLLNASPEIAVQINHIAGTLGHFDALKIDTSLTPPSSQLSDAEKQARRFCSTAVAGSCAAVGELFFPYPALELWNGYDRIHQIEEFLRDRLGIWVNHLNQGLRTTAIYDTDTHEFFNTRSGGARTWTPASTDAPAALDDDEIGAAVKAGRAVGGQGVYVQTRLYATLDPGNPATTADFTLAGSTQASIPDAQVTLEVHVQAPTWAPYDTIEIYHNASTSVTGCNDGVPVLFTANPTGCLELAGQDTCASAIDLGTFARNVVNVHPGVPGGERFDTLVQVPLVLSQDAWLAVIVRGTDGVSQSMFPVMPASLGEGGVMALGATNALYVDVDGDADLDGDVFEPPGVSCTNCASFCGP